MQRNCKKNTLMNIVLFSLLSTAAHAGTPLWTIFPAPGSNPTQIVPENGTATVNYRVQNQSSKSKRLTIQPIPGIIQTTTCKLTPKGKIGSSCSLILAITGSALPKNGVHGGPVLCQSNPDGSPNPNQCYQPNMANSLNITRRPSAGAVITVNPTSLNLFRGKIGLVTITNSATSPEPAYNVGASIPLGSNISVQSTTCGTSLAIGARCTIRFTAPVPVDPTTIAINGTNTNTVNITVTVTNQPQISITNPVQQSRVVTVFGMTPLSLEITNNADSAVNAQAITVSNKAGCPNLSVDDSACSSLAPGASCLLELTSNTPYAPCMITVSGSNTANSPQSLIAFFHLGGLVFQENNGSGKVIIDVAQQFNSLWTILPSDISNATSLTDGFANTGAIVNDLACSGDTANCAAQKCQDISPEWYLPAIKEWSAVHNALCSNNAIPCNFGNFLMGFYWSSSQFDTDFAWFLSFPLGVENNTVFNKTSNLIVRCVRVF
ncbi:DUF1566 domain-containing protein [Legionella clemsonensis]|uniref:Protein with a bacterial immunoglobulin-like domain protein n=1 Tax=Legionella clemsonensis TaxID=1867846 RepID=A0A222P3U9_9GAMM|nr:DUF1566 domain-containing protein [Legionella clemsonensis]ASQ46512.1 hypothetical protein clem_09815 [Legionella clemsonensis]